MEKLAYQKTEDAEGGDVYHLSLPASNPPESHKNN